MRILTKATDTTVYKDALSSLNRADPITLAGHFVIRRPMTTAFVQDVITRRARSCEARSRYWAQVLKETNNVASSRIPLPSGIPTEVTPVLDPDRFYEAV